MQPGLVGGFVSALNKSYPSARLDGDFALEAEDHSPSLGDSGEQGYGLDLERSSRPGSLGDHFYRIVAIRSFSHSPAQTSLEPKIGSGAWSGVPSDIPRFILYLQAMEPASLQQIQAARIGQLRNATAKDRK